MKARTKARARRQRIPAFGEWNYAYVGGAGDWPVTQCFDSAMQAGRLVMAIPIPPSPPKPANKVVKWRESATPTLELDEEDEKQRQQVVVGLGEGEHGGAAKKQGKQQTTAVHACEAVKAIDQDLYHIPPDMLCHEPRKRLTRRSVWMGAAWVSTASPRDPPPCQPPAACPMRMTAHHESSLAVSPALFCVCLPHPVL